MHPMPGRYRQLTTTTALSIAAGYLLGCSTTTPPEHSSEPPTPGYDPVIIAALYSYVDVFNTHNLAALRAASCTDSQVQSAIIAQPLITLAVENVANTTQINEFTAHITFTERYTITPPSAEPTTTHVPQTWIFTKTVDNKWKYCQPPGTFWERGD